MIVKFLHLQLQKRSEMKSPYFIVGQGLRLLEASTFNIYAGLQPGPCWAKLES